VQELCRQGLLKQFVKFITDTLPEGLESDVQTIGKLLEDDPEAYQVFVLALRRGAGNPTGPTSTQNGRQERSQEP
jgi:hypothetical protein